MPFTQTTTLGRRFLALLFLCFCTLAAPRHGLSAETPPDLLIKTTTDEVIALLEKHPDIATNADVRERVAGMIREKVAPHFDFVAITKTAVGVHWRHATPQQQERLVEEFRELLLRTYVQVLLVYAGAGNQVTVLPLRLPPSATDTSVRIEIKQAGKAPMRMTLAMEKSAAGWKINDVSVEGVSLVTSYRSAFATKVRDSGIDGLIRSLEEKNKQSRK